MSNMNKTHVRLHNIDVQKIISVDHNIENAIISVIYLNNGYIAIVTDKEIIIYSLVLKSIIQTIENGEKICFNAYGQ
jgi:hypothetical protein